MKHLLALFSLATLANSLAATVYQDQFKRPAIPAAWNTVANSPVTLDDPNDQLDYTHVAGTSRRFLNFNDLLTGQTAYLKAEISNFTGSPSVWLGFVGTNASNNSHYAHTFVAGSSTYELFINNTPTPQLFDNGAGWRGTLPSHSGIYSITGNSTSGALSFGNNFPAAGNNLRGFGFANFGNASVFPSSSFSLDSILVDNSLIISATANEAPVVEITNPSDGANFLPRADASFTANANDPEDGDLGNTIVWSSDLDGGLGTGTSISTSALSNGSHTITASVTDSGSRSSTTSIKVTLSNPDNFPPTVSITTPQNASIVTTGNPTTFTAEGNDMEDGDLSNQVTWKSNLSGNLGQGASILIDNLAVGTHTITATTADSEGFTTSAALTITVNAATGAPEALRPNIIVIICDDAGYADFGFMNSVSGSTSQVPTPNLDALASRGVTFSRAYVAANCQPTRAAIVTGAYQASIGNENVGNNNFRDDQLFEGIPVEVDTVWDRMRNLGYTTGAIGKWHLGAIENTPEQLGNRPENQGIDQFFGFWHGSREFMAGHYNESSDPGNPLQLRYLREARIQPDDSKTDVVKEYSDYYNRRNDPNPPPQYITTILGDYAEDFVTEHYDDDKPFFLYLAHPAPHKPWSNNSPDYDDPRIAGLTPNNRRQVASMMITMDREIGDLMNLLDDPNGDGDKSDSITDETLVVFINDNGGVAGFEDLPDGTRVNGTSNGILNGFKGSAHDGGICVPMIMAGAGISLSRQGTIYNKPVHGIDLTPTSVALAGGDLSSDKAIDGVNLIPHVNGTDPDDPHEVLVHRWRGTFAVIKGDMKLVNTQNTNADPSRYRLYNVATDRGETNDLIKNPQYADLVAELKRALTEREARWDKPRYPILNRTLDSEPLNIIDHFTFRPGLHNDWSAGINDSTAPSSETANWFEGGTRNPTNLFRSDGFSGAILEFPVHNTNYTSNNDLRRKTGMKFMLNQLILSGMHEGTPRMANLTGLPLLFTRDLRNNEPEIEISATGNFDFDFDLDLILFDDLTISGNGNANLQIEGDVSEHFKSRGIKKTGSSEAEISGNRSYSGDTEILEGTLTISQINTQDETATYRIGNGATLNLNFPGTDTVGRLFIDGKQQPAGVYGSQTAGIEGTGSLTVTAGPGGYTAWAEQNAPGTNITGDHDGDTVQNGIEYFMGEMGSSPTSLPSPARDGTIIWPMGSSYTGAYGSDFHLEASLNLEDWSPILIEDVTIIPGSSLAHQPAPNENRVFIRLAVRDN